MIHLPIYPRRPKDLEAGPQRTVTLQIDGRSATVPEGQTLLDACRSIGIETPTLCHSNNLTPINACRICVVELEGARTLVPACSRQAEPNMVVATDSERVRLSRKLVIELLASSVDMSETRGFAQWAKQYGAEPERFGPRAAARQAGEREAEHAGHHHPTDGSVAATVEAPAKDDNALFVRDYQKCILCYKCVEACGTDAQHTYAIAVAGRGFDARISTEMDTPLDDSACVFCGNCIGVCPTNALVFKSEYEMRRAGTWDETAQTATNSVCPYCGVGCQITLHVQDERVLKVTSPMESSVTSGHLCIKGRFGFGYAGHQDAVKSKSSNGAKQKDPP